MKPQGALRLGATLAKLGRPQNVAYSSLLACGGAALHQGTLKANIACLCIFYPLYALAAAYNNWHDIQTDKFNHRKDNPLTTNHLPKPVVWGFVACNTLLVIGALLFMAQPGSFVLISMYLLLSYAYSAPTPRLQARGFVAPLVLAACYGVIPMLLGATQGTPLSFGALAVLTLFQILVLVPSLLAKDYKDLRGDKASGKYTPLVRYGPVAVKRAAMIIATLAATAFSVICLAKKLDPLLIYATSACYLLFVYHLHASKGVITWQYNKFYTILVLIMSLLTLY